MDPYHGWANQGNPNAQAYYGQGSAYSSHPHGSGSVNPQMAYPPIRPIYIPGPMAMPQPVVQPPLEIFQYPQQVQVPPIAPVPAQSPPQMFIAPPSPADAFSQTPIAFSTYPHSVALFWIPVQEFEILLFPTATSPSVLLELSHTASVEQSIRLRNFNGFSLLSLKGFPQNITRALNIIEVTITTAKSNFPGHNSAQNKSSHTEQLRTERKEPLGRLGRHNENTSHSSIGTGLESERFCSSELEAGAGVEIVNSVSGPNHNEQDDEASLTDKAQSGTGIPNVALVSKPNLALSIYEEDEGIRKRSRAPCSTNDVQNPTTRDCESVKGQEEGNFSKKEEKASRSVAENQKGDFSKGRFKHQGQAAKHRSRSRMKRPNRRTNNQPNDSHQAAKSGGNRKACSLGSKQEKGDRENFSDSPQVEASVQGTPDGIESAPHEDGQPSPVRDVNHLATSPRRNGDARLPLPGPNK